MGAVGIVASLVWLKVIHAPNDHPNVNASELDYLRQGGALVDTARPKRPSGPTSSSC